MTQVDMKALAQFLNDAEVQKKEVTRITAGIPDLSIEQAYQIQVELVALKLASGQKLIGPKMGITSQAKMRQMNVDEPIFGYIFDYMHVPNGGTLSLSELIHPKVEAEIAFVMGKDVEGPGVTAEQVMEATEYVLPALEIIDSRYENFKFTLPDVIADNTSASRVIFGNRIRKPHDLQLDLVGVTLAFNGEVKALGASAAVLEHPANSVALLANMLARKGKKLTAGEIILTGGITEAVMLSAGSYVHVKFDGFGEVTFSVKS
jgi:2-oxo-3-hexenedioate decarboxylase